MLRQGSLGTYFINILKMVFQQGQKGHHCKLCNKSSDEKDSCIIDNLNELEESILTETFYALVYIAGYIKKNEKPADEYTTFYFENFGRSIDALNTGGLTIPTDSIVQWKIFCFIFLCQLYSPMCRNFYIRYFMLVTKGVLLLSLKSSAEHS